MKRIYYYILLRLNGCKAVLYFNTNGQKYFTFVTTKRTSWLNRMMSNYNEDYGYAKLTIK